MLLTQRHGNNTIKNLGIETFALQCLSHEIINALMLYFVMLG